MRTEAQPEPLIKSNHSKARVASSIAAGGWRRVQSWQDGASLVPAPKLKPAVKIKQKYPHTQIHIHTKKKPGSRKAAEEHVRVRVMR